MTPVIPCSIGKFSLPKTTFDSKNEILLTKRSSSRKFRKPTLSSRRLLLPQLTSVRLFPEYRNGSSVRHRSRIQILAAIGTDVAIEEPNFSVAGEDDDKISEVSTATVETSEASSTGDTAVTSTSQSKRPRPLRKSEMPPVKKEELVPGAAFTGKVRSIQPFGAFVDFGAFTDGLVHVSRMSDSFVKDVGSIVSIGQEVKVRIVEANAETGRISLTMRENDDITKLQQRKETDSSDRPRPIRKNATKKQDEIHKSSKFVKGQVLDGTVKNLKRAGAFISLPDGEEGFLPSSEESNGFMGSSSLEVGQEVSVRVLRVTRGQVTLTMKKEENTDSSNSKRNKGVVHVGVVHAASNPFELAFHKNKDIAAFLEEKERLEKSAEMLVIPQTVEKGTVDEIEAKSDTPRVEGLVGVPSNMDKVDEDDKPFSEEVSEEVESMQLDEASSRTLISEENGAPAPVTDGVKEDSNESDSTGETSNQILPSENLIAEEVVVSQAEDTSVNDKGPSEAPLLVEDDNVKEYLNQPDSPVEVGDQILSSQSTFTEEVVVTQADNASVSDNKAVTEAPMVLENSDLKEGSNDSNAPGAVGDQILSSESTATKELVMAQADTTLGNNKVETEAPLLVENTIALIPSEVDGNAESSIPAKNGSTTSNGQEGIPSPKESTIKATVSPALVKQLREETGAGMMDCKKALAETGADIVKAQEFLRKKGLASADKKASRATAEGRIGSYIHDNRIGVLIEVNCETDFVSRGDIFKELVDDLAMQVAACPQVKYLDTEDVPKELVDKEREIEMQKEDLLVKPEQIRSKIVEGRIRKRLEEFALLEQPYIKNDKMVVKDWVKQTIATIGENIKVRKFVRYNLGEGLEKKSQDFAAEVAAQTSAKPVPSAMKDQSVVEREETLEKPPAVAVSAALVKQLREETGAGMMDCKKALTETGGNLEKAQEYLRKKGLSAADKKSSRLAAEGRISSYIHDTRIGVLIEVNCETDFVGRSEKFKELVEDLAMQVVACPQVEFVSLEEIPEEVIKKEKELEMQREDIQLKPENIRERIVEGRVSKRLGELALLEQPFIKDDTLLVKDLVKQTVAALGENIKVRRFVRFALGEVTGDGESAPSHKLSL
eukprot:TRINITY_DN1743_c0_g1_i1.p1 TRINITY_DN1743_c0_g1~~TRINITY_DN1743_c0_g1_i1.p1  ORF type:complete len:1117 (+),score=296.38 TRINITY_DN1743_c0_g1_i1:180-3530(+)